MHFFMPAVGAFRLQDIGFTIEELSFFDSYMILFDIGVVFLIGALNLKDKLWYYFSLSNTMMTTTV